MVLIYCPVTIAMPLSLAKAIMQVRPLNAIKLSLRINSTNSAI